MSEEVTTTETTTATPGQEPKVYSEEYVKQLRNEAAQHRISKNDAVDAAKAAVQAEWDSKVSAAAEKISTLETDLGDAWVYAAKLEAALETEVPSNKVKAFAAALQGVDAASIKSSADSLKELFGLSPTGSVPATDPTQGKGGGTLPLNGDPILEALTGIVNGRSPK